MRRISEANTSVTQSVVAPHVWAQHRCAPNAQTVREASQSLFVPTVSTSSNTPENPSPTPHSAVPTPPSPSKIPAYPPHHTKHPQRCTPTTRAPAPKSASHRSTEFPRQPQVSSAPNNQKSPAPTHTIP